MHTLKTNANTFLEHTLEKNFATQHQACYVVHLYRHCLKWYFEALLPLPCLHSMEMHLSWFYPIPLWLMSRCKLSRPICTAVQWNKMTKLMLVQYLSEWIILTEWTYRYKKHLAVVQWNKRTKLTLAQTTAEWTILKELTYGSDSSSYVKVSCPRSLMSVATLSASEVNPSEVRNDLSSAIFIVKSFIVWSADIRSPLSVIIRFALLIRSEIELTSPNDSCWHIFWNSLCSRRTAYTI